MCIRSFEYTKYHVSLYSKTLNPDEADFVSKFKMLHSISLKCKSAFYTELIFNSKILTVNLFVSQWVKVINSKQMRLS